MCITYNFNVDVMVTSLALVITLGLWKEKQMHSIRSSNKFLEPNFYAKCSTTSLNGRFGCSDGPKISVYRYHCL